MSWNNIPTRSGTAITALTLDDNELVAKVVPAAIGQAPRIDHLNYLAIDNRAVTVAAGGTTSLSWDRLPFDRTIRLTGTIAADAGERTLRFGIDDPAHYAAWRLAALLRERRVRVTGQVAVRYRNAADATPTGTRVMVANAPDLTRIVPAPLVDDLRIINKDSQNLHAELLLRRIGLANGTGSVADGIRRVEAMFASAQVPRAAWDFSDGSGMSTYNRIAPRGMTTLLNWAAGQAWASAFRTTLPIGGVDGTLARRFRGTSLEGRIFAKTGSLNATSALAGYMLTRSGKTLTFAAYANDVPSGTSATPAMDAALLAIAEAN